MAINISSNIFPLNNGPAIFTHEDIYGKGGFVAIATTTQDPDINDHITQARRKEGMLVYDVTTDKYYRCLSELASPNDGNWTEENFGGSSITIGEGTGISVVETSGSYTISLNASLDNLNDVSTPNPSEGQVLTWKSGQWVAQSISIQIDDTDGLVASATSPFLLWTEDPSLTESKTLIGDGIIEIDTTHTDGQVLLFINDNSIENVKLVNSTISGIELGDNLRSLSFGNGIASTGSSSYDGSQNVTIGVLFGTSAGTAAEGNHTHTLDQLSDVAVSDGTEGDILVYDGTGGWVNSNFIYGGSANSF